MGTRRSADHEKRKAVEHHVKPTQEALRLLKREPDLGDKLELAHKFAQRRLATFAEEIPQAFMARFGNSKAITLGGEISKMSTQLPDEEAESIQWEGGEENKGDEPTETRDPHNFDAGGQGVTHSETDDALREAERIDKGDDN